MARTKQPEQQQQDVETRRGVYYAILLPCPGRLIDTGLPAGEAAEAVARDRYLRLYGLADRPGRTVALTLQGVGLGD